jgi:hypothetical protein
VLEPPAERSAQRTARRSYLVLTASFAGDATDHDLISSALELERLQLLHEKWRQSELAELGRKNIEHWEKPLKSVASNGRDARGGRSQPAARSAQISVARRLR